jgi:hypothetical protein
VSEAHGGVCPEKKCGADTSIKTNVRFFRLFVELFIQIHLQMKTTSYDPFVLDCIAFIHQQALACNHNFLLSLNSGAADPAAVEYRHAMMQCRGTCLQSLHQLVQRSSTNIKSAAPDLRLDPDSLMGDEDDTRTMPERLFDEYSSLLERPPFYLAHFPLGTALQTLPFTRHHFEYFGRFLARR